ncbi:MAG: type II and III secretion system protein [Planctomycetes bacterium]|nr:type II and III secretion system protein [Planctomycetota bacterium]
MNLALAALLLCAPALAAAQDPKKDDKKETSKPPVPEKRQPWAEFCCYEKGRIEHGELVTVVYDMHHGGLAEYQRVLGPLLTAGKGNIQASDGLKSLMITDTKERIAILERAVRLVHHSMPPIWIEAKIVEVRWTKDLQIGIEGDLSAASALFVKDAGVETFIRDVRVKLNPQEAILPTPFQGSTIRFSRSADNKGSVGGLLQMFQQSGRANILSHPRVLLQSDQKATLFAGDEVPYPAEILVHPGGTNTTLRYRPTGVSLEVQPHLAAPGQIVLKVKPEVSTTVGFVQVTTTTQAPQFTVRRIETDLLVRDGEEVVIGGLYRKDKIITRRGVPFLMDIPILGYLFGKYEEEDFIQEILFYIKPTIVKSESELPRPVFDPDKK